MCHYSATLFIWIEREGTLPILNLIISLRLGRLGTAGVLPTNRPSLAQKFDSLRSQHGFSTGDTKEPGHLLLLWVASNPWEGSEIGARGTSPSNCPVD